MKKTIACSIFLATLSFSVFAGDRPEAPPPGGRELPAEVKAAMDSCMQTASKDSNGRPDRSAVDACMKAKGFEKPARPPHGDGPPPKSQN